MKRLLIAAPLFLSFAAATPALALSKVDAIIEQALKKKGIPGLSLSSALPGGKVSTRSYGSADLERQVPVKADSIFAIGSLSKSFTAIAVLILQEEGKLSVDDKLAKYFPDYPRAGEITLKNLLQHTSGIKSITSVEPFKSDQAKDWTPAEIVALLAPQPLDFEPGTKAQYSNSGCIFLGLIVEKAAGMPFADFLAQRITGPLGMTHTTMGSNSRIVLDRVLGYAASSGTVRNAEVASFSAPYASGGIFSTTADLARLVKVFRGEALLSRKSVAEMTAPTRLKDGSVYVSDGPGLRFSYGYGLELIKDEDKFYPAKTGAISGFNSFFIYKKEDDTLVALTANLDDSLSDLILCAVQILDVLKAR
ncbi:MAG: serine hydrolase [Elusimicrobia bacterium]|nr:serine hydrolase [Elusimicrobiota bacterium]